MVANKDHVGEIVSFLSRGECERLYELVRELTSSEKLGDFIEIPPSAVSGAINCLKDPYIDVLLEVSAVLDENGEYDEQSLCEDSLRAGELWESHYDMVIEFDTLSAVMGFVEKLLRHKNIIYWVTREHRVVRNPEEVFKGTEPYDYEVMLTGEKLRDPSLLIMFVGKAVCGESVLRVYSTLYRAHGLSGNNIRDVLEHAREIVEKYGLPLHVSLCLKPVCWV